MTDGDQGGVKRKTRRHKTPQLINRPLTLDSCRGPVVITAEIRNGQQWVKVSYPADVPVSQPAITLDKST
jgi:hypothetical protein